MPTRSGAAVNPKGGSKSVGGRSGTSAGNAAAKSTPVRPSGKQRFTAGQLVSGKGAQSGGPGGC